MADSTDPAPPRPRRVHRGPFPHHRRFVIEAMRAGRRGYPTHGLLDLDVTEACEILHRPEVPISFGAFVVAATARAAAAHPLVHAYRDWRGRLVTTDHVDVATLIEVEHEGHLFPLAHLVRDADIRPVAELSAELRRVKADLDASRSGRLLKGWGGSLSRVPGLARLFYWWLQRAPGLRQMAGTVSVTSVGMFASGGGAGIGPPTITTLAVLVGGRTSRPRVVDGSVVPREVLDLTITVDHAIVDGAPAARFAATLADLIERPQWAAVKESAP